MGLQPVKDVATDQNFRYLERLIRQAKVVGQVGDSLTTDSKTVLFRRNWVGSGLYWTGHRLSVLPAPDLGITVNAAGVSVKVKAGGGILIDSSGLYLSTIVITTAPEFWITKDDATAILHLKRNDISIGTNDIIGRIEFEGADIDAPGVCAKIEAIAEGNLGETGLRFSAGIAGAVAEFMRLTYIGYLGIGTVEPDTLLHIEDVAGAIQRLTRKDTAVTITDIIGRIEFETKDAGSPGIGAFVQAEAEGSVGEVGLTLATGTGGAAVERMRIKNTGVFNLAALSIYANNAAAIAGGLVAGDLYRTGGDPDPVCIVH